MGEVTPIDLKLNILAKDEASQKLTDLTNILNVLREDLSGFADLNPFAKLQEDALAFSATMRDISTQSSAMSEVATSVNEMAFQLSDAVMQGRMLDQVLNTIRSSVTSDSSMFTPWEVDLKDVSTAVVDISGEIIDIRDESDAVSFARWGEPLPELLTELTRTDQQLLAIRDTAEQVASSFGGMYSASLEGGVGGATPGETTTKGKGVPGFLGSIRGASSMLSELPMKFLYGGMNAMMGYYALQSLATGGNNFASIQQMMNLNNSTVNQAAQYQEMLGAAGMTGSSGVSFLSGLANNLHSAFFTMNGALSSTGMQLTQYGITKQDLAESPMQLLNTIGTQYRSLIGQGRGSEAANLLGLTGTTQLSGLLSNWNEIQKQTSTTNLGMTPGQLNKAVQSNVTLQVSLQKLALAFDQLSIELVPLVTRLTGAFTGVLGAFEHGQGPISDTMNAISQLQKHLGDLGLAIVGVIATIKATSFVSDILSGAGVIGEVGGGMTLGKLVGKGAKGIGGLFGLGKDMTTVAEDGAKVASTFSKLGDVMTSVWGVITDVADVIGGALAAAFTAISIPVDVLIAIIAAVGAAIALLIMHWSQVVTALTHAGSALADWTSQFINWARGLWRDVSGSLATFGSNLTGWAASLWGLVSGEFQSITSNLSKWAKSIWGSVAGDFASWASELGKWASGLWTAVAGDFGAWTVDLEDWASGLWSAASTGLDQFAQNLGNFFSHLWSGITGGAQSLFQTVTSFITGGSSVPSSLGASHSSFVSTVLPYAQQVSKATGLPVAGVVGQWAYESGWGQSVATQQNANLAGIKPFGQYGAGKDSTYAGFANLQQFANADISVLDNSRYAGARALAAQGGSIGSIYSLLSNEGYSSTPGSTYGAGVQSIAQSIANLIPHMANGGVVGSPTLAVIGEAGPEAVVPLRGAGGMAMGGSTGSVFNVTINLSGANASNVKQLAQQVASEFVNQVKRRGNFDWSG